MSMTIEQKVVEMRFDNKNFESNVATTMSTLDKLKKSLNLTGAAKGLENISSSAKKVDMSGMSTAVDTVRTKFSALEVMGVTALANITNSAVNAGKRIVSALTIDPVKTGFQEYETQLNAVQTILANTSSKGSTLDDVNKALDELNTYADKTIYNFTEMTRNIGTFTAAGVDLETSVSAIQGIANLAAVSGSTSQQASTAMYQLSQALAAGKVKLMDWNSVVNAGMGGEVFQNALKETARVHGVAIDQLIKDEGSFRESLKNGWLTSDILTDTLKKFTMAAEEGSDQWNKFKKELMDSGYTEKQAVEILKMANTATDAATKVKTLTQLWDVMKEAAQSGWAQTWRIIIGDFEEAKALFTPIADFLTGAITKMSEARNMLLESALGKGFGELSEKLSGLLTPAKEIAKVADKSTEAIRDLGKVVDDVIGGKFGNGTDRIKALTDAGQNYYIVQNEVNKKLGNAKRYTEEQIAAQDKLLASQGKAVDKAKEQADETDKLTQREIIRLEYLTKLSDEQLRSKGYSDEQIKTLHELTDTAEKLGLPVRELLEHMDEINGRWLLMNSFKNIGMSIVEVFSAIRKAWVEIFPPMTSEQLFNIIAAFHKFTTYLRVSEETSGNLTRTLKGLFAILDIIATIASGAFKIGFQVVSGILKAFDTDILGFTANIGDAVVAVRDWIDEHNYIAAGAEKVTRAVKTGVEHIRKWVDAFMAMPEVQSAIAKFDGKVSEILGNFGEYFEGGKTRIREFLERVKSLDSITLEDLKAVFKDFKDNVVDYFLNIDDVTQTLKDAFANLKEAGKTYFEKLRNGAEESITGVKGFLGDLLKNLMEFASTVKEKVDINWGSIMAIGTGVALIMFLKKLGNLLDFISNFSLSNLFGLEEVLEAYAKKIKAEALQKTAIAIGIMAASVALLAMMDWKKVLFASGVLVVLYGALIGLSVVQNKFGSGQKLSLSMTAIAGALLLLAFALKQFEGLDFGTITTGVITLGILAAGMVGAMKLLSGKDIAGSFGAAAFIIAFAASLKILIGVLKDVNKLNVTSGSIATLTILIGSLALAAKAAKGIRASSFVGLIGVVISLKLFLGTLKDICDMDFNKIRRSMDEIVGILGMFALLTFSTKLSGANAGTAGLGILAMSAALLVVVKAMKNIGEIDPIVIDRATNVISKLLIVFGLVTAMSKLSGANAVKAGTMLLEMAGAMLIISGAMKILGTMSDEDCNRALKAVMSIGLLFGALITVTAIGGETEARKVNGTLIILATTIGVLAIALGAISMIPETNLENATKALTSLIGVFALLVASTNLVKKSTGTIILMTTVVGLLAGMLVVLSALDVGSTLETAEALSLLLLSLSAALLIVSNVKMMPPGAIKALYAVSGALAIIATITGVLTYLDVAPSLETAEALSLLLLSLSAACLILSAVGPTGTMAVKGALALDGVVLVVGGLMAGLGALVHYFPDMEKFLDKGIPILEKIGWGLGSFFSNIVAGLTENLGAGLPKLGEDLSTFMDKADVFFEGIKDVDQDSVNGVKNLASTILTLTASDLIQRITSFFGGSSSIENFANNLPALGKAMAAYSAEVSGKIDAPAVEASATAAQALAKLANALPSTGGKIKEWFTGEQISLTTFGAQLESFGHAIVGYSNVVTGINPTAITASANAGMALSDLANSLPSTGGKIKEWFTGEQISLPQFGAQLRAFGYAIVDYSNTVAGKIDADAITASANAAMTLSDLANNLPSVGGKVSEWFLGEQVSLSQFGIQLSMFGKALVDYSNTIVSGNVDAKAITASANAASTMSELANKLPSTGGKIAEWFGGKMDLEKFGSQLKSFGWDFMIYSARMNLVKADVVTTTSNAAASIVTLANSLPDNEFFKNETTLKDFGKQLASFGTKFKEYYDIIKDVNPESLAAITTQIYRLVNLFGAMVDLDTSGANGFAKALKNLATAGIDDFITEFENSKQKAIEAVKNFSQDVADSMNNYQQTFQISGKTVMAGFMAGVEIKKLEISLAITTMMNELYSKLNSYHQHFLISGKTVMVGFIEGVKVKKPVVLTEIVTMLNDCFTALNTGYAKFYSAGLSCVQGFADGIDQNTFLAEAQARAMAMAAYQAAMAALAINSPSKIFRAGARSIPEGFAMGIDDGTGMVKSSAKGMAETAINSTKDVLSRLASIISSDIDPEPTIRPVLDLSDVEAKASRLSSMFSTNQAVSISRSMNRDSYGEIQNGAGKSASGNTFNFTQNNYSPKALSRVEIYRQTKNQFSAMERKVNA